MEFLFLCYFAWFFTIAHIFCSGFSEETSFFSLIVAAEKYHIPNFLLWKFCGKAQFPHSHSDRAFCFDPK